MKRWYMMLLGLCAVLPAGALELNEAQQADLEQLKGVGVALSERLIEERRKMRFTDWGDVMRRVPGVKERTARRLSDQGLTVRGARYEGSR